MNANELISYERLLKLAGASLNTNQNGEELICFYPNKLRSYIEERRADMVRLVDKLSCPSKGLTDEEIDEIGNSFSDEIGMIPVDCWRDFARAILKRVSEKK